MDSLDAVVRDVPELVAASLEEVGGVASRRIAIAAGGNAGRATAGLAIAAAYRERCDDCSVVFLGTPNGIEERMIEAAGERLELVPGRPLLGEPWSSRARAGLDCVRGVLAARRVLTRYGSELVVGVGGYASAGALLAARSLGIPTLIHEPGVVPGMTNHRLAGFADRICVAHEATRPFFGATPTTVTGNPVRPELFEDLTAGTPWTDPRGTQAHIFVMSGPVGSQFVNERVPSLLGKVAKLSIELEVWHQCGEFDPEPIRETYQRVGVTACVKPFIDAIGQAYQWSDYAISCAGPVTMAELRAAGVPALLIPNRSAPGDAELHNAMHSGSWWVREDDWSENAVAMELGATLRDRLRLDRVSRRMRECAPKFAGDRIVAECEALLA